MVTYELVMRNDDTFTYHYWPEDDRSAKYGTITVDLPSETTNLVEPAEKDFKSRTTGANMNTMRDGINRMRLERGEEPLTEKELPTEPNEEVYEWWVYYDHALSGISKRHDAGEAPEHDMAAWY